MKNKLFYLLIAGLIISCGDDSNTKKKAITVTKPTTPQPEIERPDFSPDSAYLYIKQQVDFGPRFPNNEAHGRCP